MEGPFTRVEEGSPLFDIRSGGKRGFINSAGEIVIPPSFGNVGWFSEGLAAVEVDGRWGYVDRRGAFVIPPQFASAGFFKEGLADFRRESDGRWGYIDKQGRVVIEPQFDIAHLFHEGVARVGFETLGSKLKGRFADVGMECHYRYIDRVGRYVVRPPGFFQELPEEPHPLRPIRTASGVGYVSEEGRFVIAARFQDAYDFVDGLAVVRSEGSCGFIDETGAFVIPPRFAYAFPFERGLAEVTVEVDTGKILAGYINRAGEYVWQPSD